MSNKEPQKSEVRSPDFAARYSLFGILRFGCARLPSARWLQSFALAASLLLSFGVLPSRAGNALRWAEPWGAVFAEERVTFHLEGSPGVERAGWALTVDGAVIARGEVSLAGGPAAVVVSLPKLREGVAVAGALTAEAGDARVAKRLWIFASDPWHGRKQALESLNLRVFDPDGTTATTLEKAGLPFKTLRSTDALAEIANGIVILAEGLSLDERKGLALAARQAAERGARVLWMAPGEGAMPLPGAEEEGAARPASAIALRRADIVTGLDKRLAADDWRGKTAVMSSLHPSAEKRRVDGDWRKDVAGWSWLDVRWPGGGRLIACGIGVIGAWDQGPAARYFLSAVLEELRQGGVR